MKDMYVTPPLVLTPDVGVPIPAADTPPEGDLRENLDAFAATVQLLHEHGLQVPEPDENDQQTASALASSYASNPALTSKAATANRLAKLTPASLLQTRAILDEFGQQVVQRSVEIRHMVTNKLVLETENPDPRVRIRALELLGKITDVGLFSERSEVTVTHQSTDELREKLREKLRRLRDDVVDIDPIEPQPGTYDHAMREFGLDAPRPGAPGTGVREFGFDEPPEGVQ